jgi:hypothetical protein
MAIRALHNLRRTFATRLAEPGVLPLAVERFLNHRLGSIANHPQSTQLAAVYNLATFLPENASQTDACNFVPKAVSNSL